MGRIAARDRPYERNMDRNYIEELRLAYENFVASYNEGPLLIIDTNDLNIVQRPEDLRNIVERVKSTLSYGTYQRSLPGVEGIGLPRPQALLEELEAGPHRLTDFQEFHMSLDAEKGFDPDPYLNFIGLSEEIGELAQVLKTMWSRQAKLQHNGTSTDQARRLVLGQHRTAIQDELADCLAYLLKLSNYAGIDLEAAYLEKMQINSRRRWEDGQAIDDHPMKEAE
jgi:NTP pyrophosphatase (non-canonical NTP hydrolase)